MDATASHRATSPTLLGPRLGWLSGPESLGLLLTYRCTACCDDCCFECSPQRREMLPLDDALSAIDQWGEIGSAEGITLSGGESFLRWDDLRLLVRRARQRGLVPKVVSNGYWALDRQVALAKLRPLVEDGLAILEISTDDYHARHVPLERVAHALEAAHALEVETHVVVISDRETRSLKEILAALDLSFEPEVTQEFSVLPVGFAGERIPARRVRTRPLPAGLCAEVLRRPAINPGGEVFACCAVAGFTSPLKLGDLGERPLTEQLDAGRDEPLMAVLQMDGPKGLAEIAAAHGVFDLAGEWVDECHLCRALLADEKVVDVLRQELDHNGFIYFLRRAWAERAAPAPPARIQTCKERRAMELPQRLAL